MTEGNSGTKNFVFTVTRSGDVSGVSSVDYATASGTATGGGPNPIPVSDFISVSGQVSFGVGSTTGTITVKVKGDIIVEPNETFFVNLSNCVGCSITDNQGVGAILNDD